MDKMINLILDKIIDDLNLFGKKPYTIKGKIIFISDNLDIDMTKYNTMPMHLKMILDKLKIKLKENDIND